MMKDKRLSFPAVLFLVVISVTLAFVCGRIVARTPASGPAKSNEVVAQQSAAQAASVAVFTLRQSGFESSEVTLAAGSFSFKIDNRSGAEGITVRLARDGGEQVLEYSIPPGAGDMIHQLDLQAGAYTLSVAEHQDWLCHITAQ